MFLRRTKRYLQNVASASQVTFEQVAKWLDTFLCGDAERAWDVESIMMETSGAQPTWLDFKGVMLRTFAAMLPMREARMKLHKLVQVNAVDDYAREMRALVLSLAGSQYAVSDAEFLFKYYHGLLPPVREYIDLHAPPEWYQTAQELIETHCSKSRIASTL